MLGCSSLRTLCTVENTGSVARDLLAAEHRHPRRLLLPRLQLLERLRTVRCDRLWWYFRLVAVAKVRHVDRAVLRLVMSKFAKDGNSFRREWDKEAFEKRAKERLERETELEEERAKAAAAGTKTVELEERLASLEAVQVLPSKTTKGSVF